MSTTYKIGEAATLLNLKTYVLRFWETEFPQIAPLRTDKGQRLYTREHLALLERIRFLLHERGLTIEGARKVLSEESERGTTYTYGMNGHLDGAEGLEGEEPDGLSAGADDAGSGPASMPHRVRPMPFAPFTDTPFAPDLSSSHAVPLLDHHAPEAERDVEAEHPPLLTEDELHFIAAEAAELFAVESAAPESPAFLGESGCDDPRELAGEEGGRASGLPLATAAPQHSGESVELAGHKARSRATLLEIAAELETVAYLLRASRPGDLS